MSKIHVFGDSWAAGAELNKDEKSFTNFLEIHTEHEVYNYSQNGHSLGQIIHEITTRITDINKQDFVIIIIPPDIRWYTERNGKYLTLAPSINVEYLHDEVNTFYKNKTNEWFQYHQSLFLYTLQNLLFDNHFIIQHNYGKIIYHKNFEKIIDIKNNFIDYNRSLTNLLNKNKENDLDLIGNLKGHPDDILFTGQFFKGKNSHPNEKGHKFIYEMIISHTIFKKWESSRRII